MKVLVILFVLVGISLLYSGMSEVEARTGYPFIIFLEDTTINQHSFITTDGDFPIVTVPKEQTVSIPFKVHPFVSEPLSVTFSHSIETAIPDSHKATMPNMKIEFEPFNMVLKPHESQMLNVTITALNYTQIGEHRITVTAKYPQGEPLLSTGFDVLVINTEKNPCWDKSENHARPCTLFESEKFFDFMGSAWMESKHQEMINALQSDTFHDWIEKTPNHYHWNVYQYYSDTDDYMKYLSHQSPLKQIQSGISFDEIQCKENLVLIQKYDGSPACVTESTKQKLIERGWTTKDSSAQEIIERLKQNTQPVNEVDARYIETLALMNQTVSNFVYGVDWTSHCCGYSENNGSYEITITFLNLENHKQLGVTFDAETMKITDIQHNDAINIGKGLSSEPVPYRLVALREFPDESAYYHKINSLSEIPYLSEINENKTTIITSEQFNDLLEWFPQKCLENNSDSYNCSNTPPIFEYNSVKYLIVSHELDSTEVYCESGLLYVVNYEKEFPDRKLDDFVPVTC